MQEKLLQFIWQYNLYRPESLRTTEGQPVHIIHPGTLNTNAGPDFSKARIRIGATQLIGNIELHVRTSDWHRHGHQADEAYRRLILHVVYEHDTDILPNNIAVLVLKDHVPAFVLAQYSNLIQTTAPLPCAHHLNKVKSITKESWLNRLLVERWQEKLESWQQELQQCNNDWRTLLYWRMAANFGFKINSTPFLLLAQSLPLNFLSKQHQLLQIEALLFGQAGMLEGDLKDDYPQSLQKEYRYLQQKYNLMPISSHLWKFMRLRPANFPTIRIAQFASLVHRSLHLFMSIGAERDLVKLTGLLTVTASGYWDKHYRFDDGHHSSKLKKMGEDSVFNVITNTIAPIQFLYAHSQGNLKEGEAALQLLEAMPAEDNNVLRLWADNGWKAKSASDAQSLLQLYNQFCSRKRCLECAIGLSIIRSRPDE